MAQKVYLGRNTTSSGVGDATRERTRGLYAEAKKLYAPGGDFMKGTEAQLARGKKRSVASGMQGLAAAGLAGTSMMGGLGKKYEEEVAQPALAVATTARLSALSGLLREEAGMEASLATRYSTTPQAPTSPWAIPRRPQPQPTAQQTSQQPSAQPAARKAPRAVPNLGPTLPGGGSSFSSTGAIERGKKFTALASRKPSSGSSKLSSYYSLGDANPFWK